MGNRHYSVDEQLCRWLLLSLDPPSSNELIMTRVLVANVLGVWRQGVTEGAGKLHKLGIIKCTREQITRRPPRAIDVNSPVLGAAAHHGAGCTSRGAACVVDGSSTVAPG